ncbi:MAG: radical SAM protein [Candidatus Burarchaeum sp.]|nr:radical SAM protein [Candidatus Burarchaeum sp.]MDO8339089.1 radical SAM protein [Candidatus Burarchaeum sp.]
MAAKILMIAPDNLDGRDARFLADVMSGQEARWIGSSTEMMVPLGAMSVCGWAQRALAENGVRAEFKVIKQLGSNGELLRQAEAFRPDFVAFSAMSHNYPNALALAGSLKVWARMQGRALPIILGGDHVSGVLRRVVAGSANAFWDEGLVGIFEAEAKGKIDFCVVGEGELTFAELLERLISSRDYCDVDGIAYFDNSGRIALTNPRRRMSNAELDRLAVLREGYESRRFYTKTYLTNPPHPELMGHYDAVSASRGCAGSCTFCSKETVFPGRVGKRSAKSVADEIEQLSKEGIRHVFFTDENFTLDSAWTVALCDELISRGLGKRISWHCQSRVDDFVRRPGDAVEEEGARRLLAKMEEAGCCMIAFGIESISEVDLKGMHKAMNVAQAKKALELVNETGIFSCALMMFGAQFGKAEKLTEEFVQKHADLLYLADRIRFAVYTPLPGTEDWLRLNDRFNKDFAQRDESDKLIGCKWGLLDTDHETLEGQEGTRELIENIYAAVYGSERWQERVRRKCELHPELEDAFSYWRKVIGKHVALQDKGTPVSMQAARARAGGVVDGGRKIL